MRTLKQYLPTVILLLIAIFALAPLGYAQAPNGFNYQAAIRNADGTIKSNELIVLEFSMLDGSSTGNLLYKETKPITTSEYGLISHTIGTGTVISGGISTINWKSGSKFLKVDLNDGSNITTISNQELQSIPFSLYANEAGTADYNNLTNKPNLSNFDQNASDDFDGNYNNLTNKPWITFGSSIVKASTGNVGIGVSTPRALLSLNNAPDNKKITLYDVNNNDHQFLGFGTSGGQLRYQVDNSTAAHVFYSGFNASSSRELIRITGLGDVGINAVSPQTKLHVNISAAGGTDGITLSRGSQAQWVQGLSTSNSFSMYYNGAYRGGFSTTTGAYNSISDKMLKTNIVPVESLLARVKELKINRYTFIHDENKEMQIGIIAQEAAKLFPEFVESPAGEGEFYSVNYAGFSMVAIKAIQEQQAELEELKEKNAEMEVRLSELEAFVQRLSK
jgi:hypothetical protein